MVGRSVARALGLACAVGVLTCWPEGILGQTENVPSRMVEVMGDSTHVAILGMERRGPGDPVLVVFAGGGVTVQGWGGWLQEVAELAPVVTWDRNGIGGSPFNGIPSTPARVVEHAHALLATLEIPPPYVMVGHSFGAVHMIYYADRYPGEVVGMVYLDPTSFRLEPHEWMGASNEVEGRTLWAEWEQELASLDMPPGQRAQLEASDVFLQTPLRDRGVPADPAVPTALLLGGLGDKTDEELAAEHPTPREARTLAWISALPNSLFLLATGAGHYVHIDDPQLAREAVRWVLDDVRPGR